MQESTIFHNYQSLFEGHRLRWDKSFLDLLVAIDCPENLLRIAVVLDNVIAALSTPFIYEIETNQRLKRQATDFLNIALSLKQIIEASSEPSFFAAAVGATNPANALRGVLNSNAKYVLLYTTDPAAADYFQKFHQTILFLEPLIQSSRNLEFKISDYSRASLGFRRLLESALIKKYLHSATAEVSNVKQLHVYLELLTEAYKSELKLSFSTKKLKQIRDDRNHPQHQQVLDYDNAKYVRRVIGLIRGIPIQRRNVVGKKVSTSRFKRTTQRLGDSLLFPFTFEEITDDEGIIWGIIESPEKLPPESIDSGEEPDEDDQGEIYLIDENIPLASYIHEFHKRRISTDTLKRLEKQNNYVPSSLQLLSPLEIKTLIAYTSSLGSTPEEYVQKIILMCMLFTSSPLDRAINLRVVDKIVEEEIESDITYELSSNHWIIKAYSLNYKTNIEVKDGCSTSEFLRLPATTLCAYVFSNFISIRTSLEPKICGYSEKTLKNLFLATFENLVHFKKGALARISNHFMLLCCEKYGPPIAALLFNRDPAGSTARNYYTTLRAKVLASRYKELLRLILPMVTAASERKRNIYVKTIKGDDYIGARNHPRFSSIRDCVKKLKNETIKLSNNILSDSGWIEFHNTYTAYVLYIYGLLTGIRPINNPILTSDKIINSAKIFIHREKSKKDEFNTRYIPLLDSVLKQVKYYEAHILAVKGRLLRLSIEPEQLPVLFFINYSPSENKKISVVNFSIAEYKKYVGRYTDLPLNSNRKLLRNFLEDPKSIIDNNNLEPLSFEMIDTMLGHANIGEQYWSSTSTLGLKAIYEELIPYLKELEKSLSIVALQGLQA